MPSSANHSKKRLYGRKQGRPLNIERQEAMETLFPKREIPEDIVTQNENIDPDSLFEFSPAQTWFEIGFGNGEHVKALMERHPDFGFLAAEPFINGMGAFMRSLADDDHKNVRVWMDDAIMVVKSLQTNSLDGIYVLNPDPWPKTRHHKRRIINPDNLNDFARVLKSGAPLIMATDVDDLAEWMATQAVNHPAFEWTAKTADDWRVMPQDWIRTRYEEKGEAAGRKQSYLLFRRK